MIKKFQRLMIVAVCSCIFTLPLAGCNTANRDNQRLGQNGTAPQGRTVKFNNMQGANPNASPNGGGTLLGDTNRNTDFGVNPGATMGMRTTPGMPTGFGTNTGGIGVRSTPGPNNTNRLNAATAAPQRSMFDIQRAHNISTHLGNTMGLNKINSVVSGDVALVGYTLDNSGRNLNDTRNMIVKRVKEVDNSIKSVVVGDSRDVAKRIEKLSTNITNNKPGNSLRNEFYHIINAAQFKK